MPSIIQQARAGDRAGGRAAAGRADEAVLRAVDDQRRRRDAAQLGVRSPDATIAASWRAGRSASCAAVVAAAGEVAQVLDVGLEARASR